MAVTSIFPVIDGDVVTGYGNDVGYVIKSTGTLANPHGDSVTLKSLGFAESTASIAIPSPRAINEDLELGGYLNNSDISWSNRLMITNSDFYQTDICTRSFARPFGYDSNTVFVGGVGLRVMYDLNDGKGEQKLNYEYTDSRVHYVISTWETKYGDYSPFYDGMTGINPKDGSYIHATNGHEEAKTFLRTNDPQKIRIYFHLWGANFPTDDKYTGAYGTVPEAQFLNPVKYGLNYNIAHNDNSYGCTELYEEGDTPDVNDPDGYKIYLEFTIKGRTIPIQPNAPTTETNSEGKPQLSFSIPETAKSNPLGIITQYKIQRSVNGGSYTTLTSATAGSVDASQKPPALEAASKTFIDTTLDDSWSTVSYKLVYANAAGESVSEASNTLQHTLTDVPSFPADSNVTKIWINTNPTSASSTKVFVNI